MSLKTKVFIIGGGLAGLSTAYFLEKQGFNDFILVEKNAFWGGKASTEYHLGYSFDITGHWLHLRNEQIKQMILKDLGLEDEFVRVERISRIWSHGLYSEYPFQGNLFHLPPNVVFECLMGAIEANQNRATDAPEPLNFEDWVIHYFGAGIAKHFMLSYNQKLWGVPAKEITSLWCQRFVPKPKLDEIVAGAVGLNQLKMGYNASFIYPKTGGIQVLANRIQQAISQDRLYLNHTLISLDTQQKIAKVKHGDQIIEIEYETLVNTNALPLLIDQIIQKPQEVQDAKQLLRANEVRYLNMGIEGQLKQKDHWVYVPELEWPVYRVGSFSNAVESMAPQNHANLYIELSDRDTPLDELMPRINELLLKMGFITEDQKILFTQERRIQNAYVIYDFNYLQSRANIHQWLNQNQIYSIGRYGDWNYSSMEDALIDGMKFAQSYLK